MYVTVELVLGLRLQVALSCWLDAGWDQPEYIAISIASYGAILQQLALVYTTSLPAQSLRKQMACPCSWAALHSQLSAECQCIDEGKTSDPGKGKTLACVSM